MQCNESLVWLQPRCHGAARLCSEKFLWRCPGEALRSQSLVLPPGAYIVLHVVVFPEACTSRLARLISGFVLSQLSLDICRCSQRASRIWASRGHISDGKKEKNRERVLTPRELFFHGPPFAAFCFFSGGGEGQRPPRAPALRQPHRRASSPARYQRMGRNCGSNNATS